MKLFVQYQSQTIEINITATDRVAEIIQQLRVTQNDLAPDLFVAHGLQILDASQRISDYAINDSDTVTVTNLPYTYNYDMYDGTTSAVSSSSATILLSLPDALRKPGGICVDSTLTRSQHGVQHNQFVNYQKLNLQALKIMLRIN